METPKGRTIRFLSVPRKTCDLAIYFRFAWRQTTLEDIIKRFHSRDQRPYWFTEIKENVCVKIEFDSRRIGLVHQYGRRDVI